MRLKFLLRPGWLGTIALVVVFATLCFTVLAPWQFSRNDERQQRNDAISESFHSPPEPLREVLAPGERPSARTEWQQVTVRGRYLPEHEHLGWQRTVHGEPAFEVLTPFRTTGGTVLLIDRGFVRPINGTRAPDYAAPPRGEVALTARVRANEHDSENRPAFEHDGQRWVYAINSGTVAADTGLPLRPGYFVLGEGQPGVLSPLPLPRLESGPFFSYALQWIAFGAMAVIAIGYLVYTESRAGPTGAFGSSARGGERSGSGAGGSRGAPAGAGGRKRPRGKKHAVAQAIAEEERREAEQVEAERGRGGVNAHRAER
ncbi:SURF1 family cytochrome oxidase biogenesis protein [Salinifilum ghardaiensis]